MKRIDIQDWKPFMLGSLFDIVKGSRLTKKDMKEGDIRYVGATAFNNGITNHFFPTDLTNGAINSAIYLFIENFGYKTFTSSVAQNFLS
mgnify:CR=1 FL=1